MRELLGRHFRGVTEAQFRADLADKRWAVLLEDDERRLVGFTTLDFYSASHRRRPISVVCSGDTIVDPSGWGGSALLKTWIENVLRLHRREGEGELYWLLLTSGFRTYRFLPVFWESFFPRYDRPTPRSTRRLIDQLARERFGDRYDAASGRVRLRHPQVLRRHLRRLRPGRSKDPHVGFFESANPGHTRGDELVCLTRIHPANLTKAGRRILAATGDDPG